MTSFYRHELTLFIVEIHKTIISQFVHLKIKVCRSFINMINSNENITLP